MNKFKCLFVNHVALIVYYRNSKTNGFLPEQVRTALADVCKKEGIEDTPAAVYAFLIERVRANLHIVLGMSPVGEPFRSVHFYVMQHLLPSIFKIPNADSILCDYSTVCYTTIMLR